MRSRVVRLLTGLVLASPAACTNVDLEPGGGGSGGASSSSSSGFGGEGDGGGECSCAPGIHETRIIVLGGDGAIWSFDPDLAEFSYVRDNPCGIDAAFSMAVDASGLAWILDVDTEDLFTVDLNAEGPCGDSGYEPGPLQGEFGLFGMAFAARSDGDRCADLFAHTYSGSGPFGEGPSAGAIGRLNAQTLQLEKLASIDYDGGELAGTGDARLFAFAGVEPVKLVEYERATGAVIATIPLDGFSKTRASAFSVFAGFVYFFTEATPPDCDPCLDRTCSAAYEACLASPPCAESLTCVLETGEVDSDRCSGGLTEEMRNCIAGCSLECLPPASQRVSKVSRLELANPQGGIELVVPAGPIRVVGAGTSICAPVVPR